MRSGERNGPSKCIPKILAPFSLPIAFKIAFIFFISSGSGEALMVGMKEVTPFSARNSDIFKMASGEASSVE